MREPSICSIPLISFMLYTELLLTSEYVKCFMPTVGAIDIKVVVLDLMDNSVAPDVATSENSISVALKTGVITFVCAVILPHVKLVDDVMVGCFCASRLSACVMVYVMD